MWQCVVYVNKENDDLILNPFAMIAKDETGIATATPDNQLQTNHINTVLPLATESEGFFQEGLCQPISPIEVVRPT